MIITRRCATYGVTVTIVRIRLYSACPYIHYIILYTVDDG